MISIVAAAVVAAGGLPAGGVLPGEQPAFQEMLARQARSADAGFAGSPCESAKVETVSIVPWKVTDRPDVVVWREKVRVTGCGRTAVENINVGRLGGAPPWRMTNGLPGDTLAEMKLQGSTLPAATAQAREGLEATCKMQLGDLYIAALPGHVDVVATDGKAPAAKAGRPWINLPENVRPMVGELDLSGSWMEVWPFTVCGRDRTLGVVFVPRKDRTASLYLFLPIWQQIAAHGAGARPVPARPGD